MIIGVDLGNAQYFNLGQEKQLWLGQDGVFTFVVMFQLEKMPLVWFLLNILKPNFATCDWF